MEFRGDGGIVRWTLVVACALGLAACGGGGSGDSSGNVIKTYTIGGNVSGLTGTGLVLQNGEEKIDISSNGSFTFNNAVADSQTYNVFVVAPPGNPNQGCLVSHGSGQVTSANVTSIAVNCNITKLGQTAASNLFAIAVQNNIVYRVGTSGLVITDVSTPSNPVQLASYGLPDYGYKITVNGNYAYIANSKGGLRILDISNPGTPYEVGYVTTHDDMADIVVSGNYAYLADTSGGLRIIDISNPLLPVQVGVYTNVGDSYYIGVRVNGNYAYVADNSTGLLIIDISNPAMPTEIGSLPMINAYGLDVSGDYAVVLAQGSGLHIVDISNPVLPTEVGTYNVSTNYLFSVTVSADYCYFIDGGYGRLQILNISNPVSPTETGSIDDGLLNMVAVSGNYAYATDSADNLHVIDISNPVLPLAAGTDTHTPTTATDIAVNGSYAYIADGNNGLRIIDTSDPSTLNEVGAYYPNNNNIAGVAVNGSYAYIVDKTANVLRAIDIGNPVSSSLVGSVGIVGSSTGPVVVNGNYAYVASTYGIIIYDITTPASLGISALVASYPTPVSVSDFAISVNHIYVADGSNGLRIADISNPAAPVETGVYSPQGYVNNVSVRGDYAYVLYAYDKIDVVDVSDPSLPIWVATYALPNQALSMNINGNYIYLGGATSFSVFDINYPASPVLVGEYTYYRGQTTGFAFANGNIYTCHNLYGSLLQVFQFTP